MFRVTDAEGELIIETPQKSIAEESKRQYEGCWPGKTATLADLTSVRAAPKEKPEKVTPQETTADDDEQVSAAD